jgi:hypothetical protein
MGNAMFLRILLSHALFFLMVLSLEAQIVNPQQPIPRQGVGGGVNGPGHNQLPGQMNPQMMAPLQVDLTGTIETIGQGRIQISDAQGMKRIVVLNQQTTFKTTGEATVEFLKQGVNIEFKAEADGKGGISGKVEDIGVISANKDNPAGVFPEGGEIGKAGAKKSTAPTGMCKFVGQIKGVRNGKYQLAAGRATSLFEVSDEAKISIDASDASFAAHYAAKGDKIEVSGLANPNMPAAGIQAKSVKITLAEPLGGESKKKADAGKADSKRSSKALKPKKGEKSEGLPAPAEDK